MSGVYSDDVWFDVDQAIEDFHALSAMASNANKYSEDTYTLQILEKMHRILNVWTSKFPHPDYTE